MRRAGKAAIGQGLIEELIEMKAGKKQAKAKRLASEDSASVEIRDALGLLTKTGEMSLARAKRVAKRFDRKAEASGVQAWAIVVMRP